MYFGLLRIPTHRLFAVTGWLIILLAAGMAGQSAAFLVQAGLLPGIVEPLWDSSSWLPEGGAPGQLLQVLVGYDDRPSAMQLLAFLATLAGIAALARMVNRSAPPAATSSTSSACCSA